MQSELGMQFVILSFDLAIHDLLSSNTVSSVRIGYIKMSILLAYFHDSGKLNSHDCLYFPLVNCARDPMYDPLTNTRPYESVDCILYVIIFLLKNKKIVLLA